MVNPINDISKFKVNPCKIRETVTKLNKPGILLSVIVLESVNLTGRTYQAYKRGGFTEARERFCEEFTADIFWMGGVAMFNKLGDKIGKKFLGIKKTDFDVAKDTARDPFSNLIRKFNISELDKDKLMKFKFAKVASSVLLACGLMGFVIPKLNQAVTKMLSKKEETSTSNNPTTALATGATPSNEVIKNPNLSTVKYASLDSFTNSLKGVNSQQNTNSSSLTTQQSFKGKIPIETLSMVTNNLENNAICRLLAMDTGIISGRAINARNKDERVEILFRDLTSMYFYYLATGHVISALTKRDGFGGKLTALDPTSAGKIHNEILKSVSSTEGMSLENFKKLALGSNLNKVQENLSKIDFKNKEAISLGNFLKSAKEQGLNLTPEKIKKAKEMSKLQPQVSLAEFGKAGRAGHILTKQQVFDVLNDSVNSKPQLLKNIMNDAFNGNIGKDFKFVAQSDIRKLRANMDNYVKAIIEYAEKNNLKNVAPEMLLKLNKTNLMKNAIHTSAGLGVAALFLSTIIPKLQYAITKWRTGQDGFPGVKE